VNDHFQFHGISSFRTPSLLDHDGLRANKLGFQSRLALLQEHLNDFFQIRLKFVEAFRLRVGTGKTGHISHVQVCVRTLFNDGSICLHHLITP
jgi:hypothetical protein